MCSRLGPLCAGPPVPTGGSLLLHICSKSNLRHHPGRRCDEVLFKGGTAYAYYASIVRQMSRSWLFYSYVSLSVPGPPVPTGGSLMLHICSKSDLLRGGHPKALAPCTRELISLCSGPPVPTGGSLLLHICTNAYAYTDRERYIRVEKPRS